VTHHAGRAAAAAGHDAGEADAARLRARLAELEAENARLHAALRIGRLGSLTVDPATGDRSAYSPGYLALHGLPPGTPGETRQQWLGRLHPDDRERADRELAEALRNLAADYASEFRVVRPGGQSARWISARGGHEAADPLNGAPARFAVAQHDVTERRMIEEALRESEARFRAAVEAVSGIVWTNDAAGEMAGEQPGWSALTGQTREEYQGTAGRGRSIRTTPSPRSTPGTRRWPSPALRFEHACVSADGAWRRFSVRAVPRRRRRGPRMGRRPHRRHRAAQGPRRRCARRATRSSC
jgi:PAS domain-containing protein